jgi:hypothetical protein
MLSQPPPIKELPDDYEEVYYLNLLQAAELTSLNIIGTLLLLPFFLLMLVWIVLSLWLRGEYIVQTQLPMPILLILVLMVLPLHELVHGIAIRWARHKPYYGAKYADIGRFKIPIVLFATADDALFRRNQFIVIALAPAIIITLLGMALVTLLPDYLSYYIMLAVMLNGSGAVGDFWMTVIVLRYPPDALVRDEADSVRIYARHDSKNTEEIR